MYVIKNYEINLLVQILLIFPEEKNVQERVVGRGCGVTSCDVP
jgi:hypothetical protein